VRPFLRSDAAEAARANRQRGWGACRAGAEPANPGDRPRNAIAAITAAGTLQGLAGQGLAGTAPAQLAGTKPPETCFNRLSRRAENCLVCFCGPALSRLIE